MTRTVVVEFTQAQALVEAARVVRAPNCRLIDAYSPYPVEELAGFFEDRWTRVRPAMLVGGFAVAALAYALEWWSAVFDYPVNSGGRPLHSWPAFMMFPFSVGILAAAVCGLVAVFVLTGLPRLHHPVFEAEALRRTSQDRFALALEVPETNRQREHVLARLRDIGAVSIEEVAL